MEDSTQQIKIGYFEGLRGFLALVVLIHHFILIYVPEIYYGSFDIEAFSKNEFSFQIMLATTPLNIFMNGHLAVCVFFGLSGFVLSIPFKDEYNHKRMQSAILKRYIRLVLPVLIICIFIFLFFRLGAFPKHSVSSDSFYFNETLFAKDLSFLQMIKMAIFDVPISGSNIYLPLFWTIQIEYLGVLILFSFIMFSSHIKNKLIFGSILIIVSIFISKFYFPIIIIGSLICFYQDQIKLKLNSLPFRILPFILFLFLAGIPNVSFEARSHTFYSFVSFESFDLYPYFHQLAVLFLLIFMLVSRTAQRFFTSDILTRLGRLTYSIYLLHIPIIYLIYVHSGANVIKGSYIWLMFFISVILTLIASVFFYTYVDKNAIKLSEKVAGQLVKE